MQDSQLSLADNDAQTASSERQALHKAQAQLQALEEETEVLKGTQIQASEQLGNTIAELERKAAQIRALEAQLLDLKNEKEDSANKLSELEIEILELRESQETDGDERERTASKVRSLEDEVTIAKEAVEQAQLAAFAKEADVAEQTEKAKQRYDGQIKAMSDEHAALVTAFEALKVELAAAVASVEQARIDAIAKEEAYMLEREEAQEMFTTKELELTAEIQKILSELEVFHASSQSASVKLKRVHRARSPITKAKSRR